MLTRKKCWSRETPAYVPLGLIAVVLIIMFLNAEVQWDSPNKRKHTSPLYGSNYSYPTKILDGKNYEKAKAELPQFVFHSLWHDLDTGVLLPQCDPASQAHHAVTAHTPLAKTTTSKIDSDAATISGVCVDPRGVHWFPHKITHNTTAATTHTEQTQAQTQSVLSVSWPLSLFTASVPAQSQTQTPTQQQKADSLTLHFPLTATTTHAFTQFSVVPWFRHADEQHLSGAIGQCSVVPFVFSSRALPSHTQAQTPSVSRSVSQPALSLTASLLFSLTTSLSFAPTQGNRHWEVFLALYDTDRETETVSDTHTQVQTQTEAERDALWPSFWPHTNSTNANIRTRSLSLSLLHWLRAHGPFFTAASERTRVFVNDRDIHTNTRKNISIYGTHTIFSPDAQCFDKCSFGVQSNKHSDIAGVFFLLFLLFCLFVFFFGFLQDLSVTCVSRAHELLHSGVTCCRKFRTSCVV